MKNKDQNTRKEDNKNERIRLRRERICRRYDDATNATRKPPPNRGGVDNNDTNVSESEAHVANSISHLNKLEVEGRLDVTRIRVDADCKERERRILEERIGGERQLLLRVGEKQCNERYREDVADGWKDLEDISDPLVLRDKMEILKNIFNLVVEGKGKLIDEFRRQLRMKDEDYVIALREYGRNTDEARDVTNDQLQMIIRAYEDEMKNIGEYFSKDRKKLIESLSVALSGLFQRKEILEEQGLNDMCKRKDETKKMESECRKQCTEEHNNIKQTLQNQYNQLEYELESSKSNYLISNDRIHNDHRTLTSKNVVSEVAIKKQKKRILICQGDLHRAQIVSAQIGIENQRKTSSLEQDCGRIEGQNNNLISKLRRFESGDEQKYAAVLVMHKNEAAMLAKRARTAKNIIDWKVLAIPPLRKEDNPCASNIQPVQEIGVHGKNNNSIEGNFDLFKVDEVIDLKTKRLWARLENLMVQYKNSLEERAKLCESVGCLKDQNVELQCTLQRLLQDSLNNELIVPPATTLSN